MIAWIKEMWGPIPGPVKPPPPRGRHPMFMERDREMVLDPELWPLSLPTGRRLALKRLDARDDCELGVMIENSPMEGSPAHQEGLVFVRLGMVHRDLGDAEVLKYRGVEEMFDDGWVVD